MAALPTVAANSPTGSNATARGRLSRVGRRSGAAPNLSAWAENMERTSAPSASSQSRANKWSALRREILPHPALMTISAKVQHIIEYVL
ncbi:hypothetical protein DVH05_013227 [Phytophthora capsici]|nr:hypothetical protein DVH05_013227 [Phytophthora capsici]